ncbi:MAG: 4Fe-4S dicluster domain-containing protein [Candidatus Eisenbacteria bacterium]|nr:4Fe-4S dicluster domain-containing protein [Candidatus Eisenbacteria bacterium]
MTTSSASGDRKGLLIDFTLCIGCEACMQGCREANDLEVPPPGAPPPEALNAENYTIVLPHEVNGETVYVRHLCMHCAEPACVSACPVAALTKRDDGAVVYDGDLCFGCRYCMIACPFHVPRYTWSKAVPVVRKCILCYHRLDEDREPACAAACPTGATRFGPRDLLLRIARERIRTQPERYTDHIYGEHEAGGTDVLMLAPAKFAALGHDAQVPHRALPELTWFVQKRIPWVIVTGSVLLGGIHWVVHRRMQLAKEGADDPATGGASGAHSGEGS